MELSESKKLLSDYKLKSTSCRNEVLAIFLQSKSALDQAHIENSLEASHDRVTVYRTLKTFLKYGLIHKVLDDEGKTKYALCNKCSKYEHNHEHIHFKCDVCGNTLCLDKVKIPNINMPEGYKIFEKSILIYGVCRNCQN